MAAPSLLQPDDSKQCFVTGYEGAELDLHHVYAGSRRKASDEWGCWVWMRHDVHMDLHSRNSELDKMIKRECQEAFEEKYSHEKFMEVFGKSWL